LKSAASNGPCKIFAASQRWDSSWERVTASGIWGDLPSKVVLKTAGKRGKKKTSFGLLAVMAGVAIFAMMKLVGILRQALRPTPPLEVRVQAWESGVMVQNTTNAEESVIVRGIEVEVLPAEGE